MKPFLDGQFATVFTGGDGFKPILVTKIGRDNEQSSYLYNEEYTPIIDKFMTYAEADEIANTYAVDHSIPRLVLNHEADFDKYGWQIVNESVIMSLHFQDAYEEIERYYNADTKEWLHAISKEAVEDEILRDSERNYTGTILVEGAFDAADTMNALIYVSIKKDYLEQFLKGFDEESIKIFNSKEEAIADVKSRRWDVLSISDPHFASKHTISWAIDALKKEYSFDEIKDKIGPNQIWEVVNKNPQFYDKFFIGPRGYLVGEGNHEGKYRFLRVANSIWEDVNDLKDIKHFYSASDLSELSTPMYLIKEGVEASLEAQGWRVRYDDIEDIAYSLEPPTDNSGQPTSERYIRAEYNNSTHAYRLTYGSKEGLFLIDWYINLDNALKKWYQLVQEHSTCAPVFSRWDEFIDRELESRSCQVLKTIAWKKIDDPLVVNNIDALYHQLRPNQVWKVNDEEAPRDYPFFVIGNSARLINIMHLNIPNSPLDGAWQYEIKDGLWSRDDVLRFFGNHTAYLYDFNFPLTLIKEAGVGKTSWKKIIENYYVIYDDVDGQPYFVGTPEKAREWWWDQLIQSSEVGGYAIVDTVPTNPNSDSYRLIDYEDGEVFASGTLAWIKKKWTQDYFLVGGYASKQLRTWQEEWGDQWQEEFNDLDKHAWQRHPDEGVLGIPFMWDDDELSECNGVESEYLDSFKQTAYNFAEQANVRIEVIAIGVKESDLVPNEKDIWVFTKGKIDELQKYLEEYIDTVLYSSVEEFNRVVAASDWITYKVLTNTSRLAWQKIDEPLTIEGFWKLIDTFEFGNPLSVSNVISNLSDRDLILFQKYFEQLVSIVVEQARAYSRGLSDDGLEYTARGVIGRGKDYFKQVVDNPELINQTEEWEGLGYMASQEWELRHGFDSSIYEEIKKISAKVTLLNNKKIPKQAWKVTPIPISKAEAKLGDIVVWKSGEDTYWLHSGASSDRRIMRNGDVGVFIKHQSGDGMICNFGGNKPHYPDFYVVESQVDIYKAEDADKIVKMTWKEYKLPEYNSIFPFAGLRIIIDSPPETGVGLLHILAEDTMNAYADVFRDSGYIDAALYFPLLWMRSKELAVDMSNKRNIHIDMLTSADIAEYYKETYPDDELNIIPKWEVVRKAAREIIDAKDSTIKPIRRAGVVFDIKKESWQIRKAIPIAPEDVVVGDVFITKTELLYSGIVVPPAHLGTVKRIQPYAIHDDTRYSFGVEFDNLPKFVEAHPDHAAEHDYWRLDSIYAVFYRAADKDLIDTSKLSWQRVDFARPLTRSEIKVDDIFILTKDVHYNIPIVQGVVDKTFKKGTKGVVLHVKPGNDWIGFASVKYDNEKSLMELFAELSYFPIGNREFLLGMTSADFYHPDDNIDLSKYAWKKSPETFYFDDTDTRLSYINQEVVAVFAYGRDSFQPVLTELLYSDESGVYTGATLKRLGDGTTDYETAVKIADTYAMEHNIPRMILPYQREEGFKVSWQIQDPIPLKKEEVKEGDIFVVNDDVDIGYPYGRFRIHGGDMGEVLLVQTRGYYAVNFYGKPTVYDRDREQGIDIGRDDDSGWAFDYDSGTFYKKEDKEAVKRILSNKKLSWKVVREKRTNASEVESGDVFITTRDISYYPLIPGTIRAGATGVVVGPTPVLNHFDVIYDDYPTYNEARIAHGDQPGNEDDHWNLGFYVADFYPAGTNLNKSVQAWQKIFLPDADVSRALLSVGNTNFMFIIGLMASYNDQALEIMASAITNAGYPDAAIDFKEFADDCLKVANDCLNFYNRSSVANVRIFQYYEDHKEDYGEPRLRTMEKRWYTLQETLREVGELRNKENNIQNTSKMGVINVDRSGKNRSEAHPEHSIAG